MNKKDFPKTKIFLIGNYPYQLGDRFFSMDLYSNLLKSNISSDKFSYYVNNLIEFCKSNNITLLRTIGIIFTDEGKNISDYVR